MRRRRSWSWSAPAVAQAADHGLGVTEWPCEIDVAARLMTRGRSIEVAREFSKGFATAARGAFDAAFAGLQPSEDLRSSRS